MNAKSLTRIAMIAVLTFLFGFIKIPIGPVPISLQTLGVCLAAVFLSPLEAGLSMTIHLLLKLLLEGSGLFTLPSFGFLLGFILGAVLGSYYLRAGDLNKKRLLISLFIASIVPYLLGLPIMDLILSKFYDQSNDIINVLKIGLIPFIPGDLLKILLAYIISNRLRKYIVQ